MPYRVQRVFAENTLFCYHVSRRKVFLLPFPHDVPILVVYKHRRIENTEAFYLDAPVLAETELA